MRRWFVQAIVLLSLSSALAAAGIDQTWTGAGTTPNLSEAANWAGAHAPSTGDRLILPSGAARTSLNNDLADAAFLGIVVTGGAHYTFGGNPLTLGPDGSQDIANLGDYSPSVPASELAFANEVRIAGSEASIQGNGTVRFLSTVTLAATSLRLAITGASAIASFEGPVIASGSLRLDSYEGRGHAILASGGNAFPGGIDIAANIFQPAAGALPAGVRLNVTDYGYLYLDDVTATVGDFSCRGLVRIHVGVGALHVTGSGSMYHCAYVLQISGNPPSSAGGAYVLVYDEGASPFDVQYPDPGQGQPFVVNGSTVSATYQGGASGHDFALAPSPAVVPDTMSVGSGGLVSVGSGQVAQTRFRANVSNFALGPVPGASVTFSAPVGCGTFGGASSAEVTTDAGGIAMAPPFTAGVPGNCTVTAQVTGQALSTSFAVVVYDPATLRISPDLAVRDLAPGASVPSLAVSVKDAAQRPLFGLDVVFTAEPGCGSFYSGLTYTSPLSSDGVARSQAYIAPGVSADCYVDARTSDGALGTRFEIRVASATPPAQPASWQDMWWAGPAENGWGMSIVQHRDILFGVLYAYDDQGKPTWYVLPSGTWNAAHTVYSGLLYVPRSTPYFAYDATRFDAGAPVGSAALTFNGPDSALLQFSIDGKTGTKNLVRDPFGPAVSTTDTGHGDMWWGGASQNGWGIAVLQQYASLFSVWFTYDASGAPTWFVMPAGTWTSPGTYEGRLYRTTGSRWLYSVYDPSQFKAVDVGSFRLRFSGDTATLDYTIDGVPGTLALERTPF